MKKVLCVQKYLFAFAVFACKPLICFMTTHFFLVIGLRNHKSNAIPTSLAANNTQVPMKQVNKVKPVVNRAVADNIGYNR